MTPVAILLMVLGYALRLASMVAKPISDTLQLQYLGDLAGVGVVTVLSALVLVFVSFVAVVVARTCSGERITRWFENSLFGRLPQYKMVKSMAEGLANLESASGIRPALISIEGGWQIGYLLEPLENGWQECIPAAGAHAAIRQFDVSSGRPRKATEYDDGPGHDDHKAHGSRIRRGSSWRGPAAATRLMINSL